MEYIHNYHKDVNVISINKVADHNFFIPKKSKDKKSVYKNGSRFINLNGIYDFHYYKSFEKYQENDSFIKVKVPTNFQYYGKGNVCYLNCEYLFDLNPPYVPDSDFGVYRKFVKIKKKKNKKYYLNFDGKDSSLYLYINQKFVGFDCVSHANSEFDVTNYLIDGRNEILVFVYVFSVGSYFECQDKFRLSGLFRDIYLLEREEKHINSYKITYQKENTDIKVMISFDSDPIKKTITLKDKNKIIFKGSTLTNEISFLVKNPILWNAEHPYLYNLEIIANNEYIYDYVAFRFVKLINNIFTLNDKHIKLLGVNHHDSKYESGYYLTLNDYKKDLKIMKSNNMNCVRFSHYPPEAQMLYLCDELGMYVIDEADLECHGSVFKSGTYNFSDYDYITDNEIFKDMILDREKRLMIRDFNHASIIMFSAGNEAGYGSAIIKAIKYMQKYDSSRLIHYESTYTHDPNKNNYKLDFISKMYPCLLDMKEIVASDERSLFLCEYSHSMGNSCGDVFDYVNLIYSSPKFFGGCIWEFNDHLFPIDLNLKKPGYGGDFNEPKHDANFCVDGLLDYKRKGRSNLKEVKKAYSKIIIIKENNKYYLENRYDFTDVDKITLKIKSNNKTIIKKYSLKASVRVFVFEKTNETSLNFELYLKNKLVNRFAFKEDNLVRLKINNQEAIASFNNETLSNEFIKININQDSGLISSLKYKNKDIFKGSNISLIRAYLDNDKYERITIEKLGLDNYKVELINQEFINNKLKVAVKINDLANGVITYNLNKNDLIISLDFNINENIEFLPRFGLEFLVNKKFKKYEYLGFGPYESYVDKYHLDYYSTFKDKIKNKIDYLKPQENGSHLASSLTLKSNDTKISILGFSSFNYSPYSLSSLIKTKHNYELKEDVLNHLFIDYMMSGVGSNSCGPRLENQYRLNEKHIVFDIELKFN